MFSILRGLACLVLLCTWSGFILTQDSPIRTSSKKMTLPYLNQNETDIIFYQASNNYFQHDHEKYGYYVMLGICNKKGGPSLNMCNLTMQNWLLPRIQSLTICKNYEISEPHLGIEAMKRLSDNNILLYLESDDKFIAKHKYPDYFEFKISIFNMENCSNVANISFKSKISNMIFKIIVFDETFEIIVGNKTYCNGMPTCKIIYDLNGNQIGDPKPFEIGEGALFVREIFPLSYKSSDKGYYALLGKDYGKYRLKYIDSSGKSRHLMTLPERYFYPSVTIAKNDLFTYCHTYLNNYEMAYCTQFDTQGTRLNVTIDYPSYCRILAVHNLVGGGLLIIFGDCYVETKGATQRTLDNKFQIQRIGADGHMFQPLIIDEFDETDVVKFRWFQMLIVESNRNEFCFVMLGRILDSYSSEESGTIRLLNYEWCIPQELTL